MFFGLFKKCCSLVLFKKRCLEGVVQKSLFMLNHRFFMLLKLNQGFFLLFKKCCLTSIIVTKQSTNGVYQRQSDKSLGTW